MWQFPNIVKFYGLDYVEFILSFGCDIYSVI